MNGEFILKEKLMMISLGLLPLIMVLGNSTLIPLLPNIQQSLDLNELQTGFILSAFTIPAAILIPIAGILSDRYGRKKLILISLTFIMVGSVISFLSMAISNEAFSILIGGRVIQGMGAAGTTTLAMALVGDVFHNDKRATALGLLEVYNGVGKVIAPIIGATVGLVIWSAVFIVYPLVALMAFLGISRYVENVKGSENVLGIRAYFQQAFRIVYQRKKELFPLFFIGGVGLFIVFGVLYFLSFLIQETYHIDGFFKGTAFFFPLSAMTLASYWSGKRIKNDEALMKKLMLLGTSLLFVTFGLLIFVHSLSVLMFSLTLAFGGLGFVLPCVNMMITSTASDAERGFVVSLYGTTRFLGVALGPIVYGIWMMNEKSMYVYSFLTLLIAGGWLILRIFSSVDIGKRKVVKMKSK